MFFYVNSLFINKFIKRTNNNFKFFLFFSEFSPNSVRTTKAVDDSTDPFAEAPFDEMKIKKHLQKQNSTNPFEYLIDNNSNLIQYNAKPFSNDQLNLIESTKILKQNLNKTNFTNFKRMNSLPDASNIKKQTNDLIWL